MGTLNCWADQTQSNCPSSNKCVRVTASAHIRIYMAAQKQLIVMQIRGGADGGGEPTISYDILEVRLVFCCFFF